MSEGPYYYASVVPHPKYKMAWFKGKWRDYPTWLKTVEDGIKSLVEEYSRQHGGDETEIWAAD